MKVLVFLQIRGRSGAQIVLIYTAVEASAFRHYQVLSSFLPLLVPGHDICHLKLRACSVLQRFAGMFFPI